jgi:hypothetical protein
MAPSHHKYKTPRKSQCDNLGRFLFKDDNYYKEVLDREYALWRKYSWSYVKNWFWVEAVKSLRVLRHGRGGRSLKGTASSRAR